jgi:3-hydroxymyristoyl/3-hydroxydecanoyl-(acyl carrier protein) dehydratase
MNDSGFVIPATHPALEGHFPGNPIVPGVVLLDYAIAQALQAYPGAMLASVAQAKFLTEVHPGDAVTVAVERRAATCIAVSATVANRKILTATIAFTLP